jgi:hypothetical protein
MTPALAPAFRAGAGGFKNPGAAVAAPGVEGQQPVQSAAAFAAASDDAVLPQQRLFIA